MIPKFELQEQARINNGILVDGYYMINGNQNEFISVLFGYCTRHSQRIIRGYETHSTIRIEMAEAINILTA